MRVFLAPALALALVGAAQAAPPHKQGMSDADKKFLAYAAKVNQEEIQMSRLAEQKAQSPAVKAFARLMVSDHSRVESGLAGMTHSHTGAHKARAHHASSHAHRHRKHRAHAGHAKAHAPAPPPAPAPRPETGQAGAQPANASESTQAEGVLSKLKDKSGADFDSAFMTEQVDYHKDNLAKIEDEAKNTSNDDVRLLASKLAGAFKEHLELAKAVKEKSGAP